MDQAAMKHAHRYRVESPNGTAELAGVCACGAVRTWPASPTENWNGSKDIATARRKGMENGLVKARRRRHGA